MSNFGGLNKNISVSFGTEVAQKFHTFPIQKQSLRSNDVGMRFEKKWERRITII